MTDLETINAFIDTHRPALETDEVRYNAMLGIFERIAQGIADGADRPPPLATWTVGGPGACALRLGPHNLLLGAVDRDQCGALAEAVAEEDYPGVIGAGETAGWFVDHARSRGHAFGEPMPQRIYALTEAPRYPGAAGAARVATEDDVDHLEAWMGAFRAEAVPHDPPVARAEAERLAGAGRAFFWEVDGEPVSMAAIGRQTRGTAAISLVYTPPELRGRGYAGSATAAAAEAVFARGKRSACLYTDLRNPMSNRCYVKIGFEPVCDSGFWPRVR